MPYPDDEQDFLDEEEVETQNDETPLVKRLRAKAEADAKELKELRNARRELAFVKAGIDTSSKLGQMFFRTFDGDVSDIEAIKAEAADIPGLLAPVQKPEGEEPEEKQEVKTEPQGSSERRALAEGATPGGHDSGVDPRQEAIEIGKRALEDGSSTESAIGFFVNSKARATHEGRLSPLGPTGRRPNE